MFLVFSSSQVCCVIDRACNDDSPPVLKDCFDYIMIGWWYLVEWETTFLLKQSVFSVQYTDKKVVANYQ